MKTTILRYIMLATILTTGSEILAGQSIEEPVQAVVAQMLTEREKTLAVAESCTGGRIASLFTAMPGASAYFLCGVVSYSNSAKMDILGVEATALEQYGAVSQQVAEEMAQGVLDISDADYAIATTGIAGPTGGTPEKPVGTVWIAVASREGVVARKMQFGTQRAQNIEQASFAAINQLRLLLLDLD
ncbi:MAG: CinA family protein [Rikenellaceae bacterium]|jgi:nicotinamide-nucleotide amidase|nr:CinA family protein [Rikenellaceae bacterium]